jgi:hypothetical protein
MEKLYSITIAPVEAQSCTATTARYGGAITCEPEAETDILVLPAFISEDEAWFYTPERQHGEAEADADIAAGRVSRFSNVDDLIAGLRI